MELEGGIHVVAVTGNHDDPALWQRLAPYLEGAGVTVVAQPRRPADAVRSLSDALHVRGHEVRLMIPMYARQPGSKTRYEGTAALGFGAVSYRILELRDSDAAVILTTHDPEQGLAVADRVVILESGRIVYDGPGRQDAGEFRKIFAEVVGSAKP